MKSFYSICVFIMAAAAIPTGQPNDGHSMINARAGVDLVFTILLSRPLGLTPLNVFVHRNSVYVIISVVFFLETLSCIGFD